MRTLSYKFSDLFLKHYFIYNPVAGKVQRNPQLVPAILETLRANFVSVEALPTTGPNTAAAMARKCAEAGEATVFVLGGDGTINEVANGLVGTGAVLGVLPGGTANCLAVELGIGLDPMAAARASKNWTPYRIAVGVCRAEAREPRHFLVMAGAGVDAQIVREVNYALKKKIGKAAYWIAGFAASLRVLPELWVESANNKAKVSFALASRVRNYGGDLEIAKTIRLGEPKFETVLFEGRFALRYMKYLAGVLINQHRGMAGVHVSHEEKLRLSAANGAEIYVQVDGELYGRLPVELEIVPAALTILAPRAV